MGTSKEAGQRGLKAKTRPGCSLKWSKAFDPEKEAGYFMDSTESECTWHAAGDIEYVPLTDHSPSKRPYRLLPWPAGNFQALLRLTSEAAPGSTVYVSVTPLQVSRRKFTIGITEEYVVHHDKLHSTTATVRIVRPVSNYRDRDLDQAQHSMMCVASVYLTKGVSWDGTVSGFPEDAEVRVPCPLRRCCATVAAGAAHECDPDMIRRHERALREAGAC